MSHPASPTDLAAAIETAWEERAGIDTGTKGAVREAVEAGAEGLLEGGAEVAADAGRIVAALDRITIPQDAVEQIATLITPGASLIVSDNKLSGETGDTTDFIVETKIEKR